MGGIFGTIQVNKDIYKEIDKMRIKWLIELQSNYLTQFISFIS